MVIEIFDAERMSYFCPSTDKEDFVVVHSILKFKRWPSRIIGDIELENLLGFPMIKSTRFPK